MLRMTNSGFLPGRSLLRALACGGAWPGTEASNAAEQLRLGLVWLSVAALGLALPLLVIWSVHHPPQLDAPNHVARHFLEALHLRGAPLPPGYEVEYRILPNLAADVLLPPLMWVFNPFRSWKLFLVGAVLLYWLGPALFILATGDRRRAAWIAALLLLPFLLSGAFLWGFLNYYVGVGLAFLAAAGLTVLDRRGPLPGWAMLLHGFAAVLLYFAHLSAVFTYAVITGCMALAHIWAEREQGRKWATAMSRAARLCIPLLAAVPLHLVYLADGADATLEWSDPVRKATMLFVGLFRGFDLRADLLVVLFWAGAVLAFFGPGLRSLRIGMPALATGAFLALYIAMPQEIGSGSGSDTRLLPVLLIVGLAWLGTLRRARWSLPGIAMLVGAISVRDADIAIGWQRQDHRLQEASLALEFLPVGARVLPVSLAPTPTKENPEEHYVSLAVITRQAYVPTLFAERDMQPLRLTGERSLVDPFRRFPAVRQDGEHYVLASEAEAARYDHLWVFNPEGMILTVPEAWEPLYFGERVALWRLRLDPSAAGTEEPPTQ